MPKLKKKELIKLIKKYKEENEILLDTINKLKKIKIEKKEIIIYKEKDGLTKKEIRVKNRINYLKKRFQITNNIIYKNELNKY